MHDGGTRCAWRPTVLWVSQLERNRTTVWVRWTSSAAVAQHVPRVRSCSVRADRGNSRWHAGASGPQRSLGSAQVTSLRKVMPSGPVRTSPAAARPPASPASGRRRSRASTRRSPPPPRTPLPPAPSTPRRSQRARGRAASAAPGRAWVPPGAARFDRAGARAASCPGPECSKTTLEFRFQLSHAQGCVRRGRTQPEAAAAKSRRTRASRS